MAPPIRVLIVDDHHAAAETLAEVVEVTGRAVRLAHDGPSAIRETLAWAPDIVLLDIGLPGMDGYQVARLIREQAPHPPRLIALTGYGHDTDRAQALAAGFDDHLLKPVDLERLTAALDR
jgi:CheY-like chemotaxis protein